MARAQLCCSDRMDQIQAAGEYTMRMTARYFADLLASIKADQVSKKFAIHTMLAGFNADPRGHVLLSRCGYLGDMFSRPLGADGSFSDEGLNVRALIMMDLEVLPAFVQGGQKQVRLVCELCYQCHDTRAEILGTIMNYQQHLFSNLVVNRRAARQLHQGAV